MHTPKEAEKLWCPMARLDGVNGSYNRETVHSHEHPTCWADQCAMWRWAPAGTTHPEERVFEAASGFKYLGYVSVPDAPTHGYCGLAGRPAADSQH